VKSTAVPSLDPAAYTVSGFCEEHHISRSYLYRLWSERRGPRRTKLGRRTLISGEAAAAWRRQMEVETIERENGLQ
jgi:predicted DNA-binding transcriptional regulator AlpA